MNNIYLFIYIIILLFVSCLSKTNETKLKKYIVLPFSIEGGNSLQLSYNSDIFIQKFYHKNIILNFYIGEPPQKINSIISNDNDCFELKDRKNISISLKEKYKPKYSSSFSLSNKQLYFPWRKTEFMTIGSDFFSFENINEKYNLSFYLQMTEKKEINVDYISEKEYIAKIGLNKPMYEVSYKCPNFIIGLKKKAKLEKYTFSFEFINSNTGNLIIGDELYNYNHKKYFKSQYVNTYSNDNFEIYFNDIIISNNNKNISFNGTYGYLSINLGVIIGTKEYKEIIDNIFFNELISQNICKKDIIELNNTQNYYVYNCDLYKTNIKNFPKLIFISKNFMLNFEFSYTDLFIKLNSKYYFLIMFKTNDTKKGTKDIWVLGQPFFIKYSFTLNVDEKLVGLYNPYLPIDKAELEEIKEINNNIKNEDNNKIKKSIYIILLIIFIIGLSILTFYMGMKIKEERKKRANELKDDNYEYLAETKEKKINSSQQTIELNSRIGI